MGAMNGKPGRPRDPHADKAILAAARDLLAEGGLSGLTVEGTAQRAGVAKTTVYRRYPTKLNLAVSAVAELIVPIPEIDSVEQTVRSGMQLYRGNLGSPSGQTAFLSVAAAASGDPEAHRLFTEKVLDPVLADTDRIVTEAQQRGEASPDASREFIFDVLMGALIHRTIIRQISPDEDFVEKFTELTRYLYRAQPALDDD